MLIQILTISDTKNYSFQSILSSFIILKDGNIVVATITEDSTPNRYYSLHFLDNALTVKTTFNNVLLLSDNTQKTLNLYY